MSTDAERRKSGDPVRAGAPSPEARAFGCLFCRTGREETVLRLIERRDPGIRAIAPEKVRYRRMGGRAIEERARLFPGYIFFCADGDCQAGGLARMDDVLRLLRDADGDWRLKGDDGRIARALFENEGLIGLSKAYYEGDRIKVVSGFLKEFEGAISRVNHRARSAEIKIRLDDKTLTVWLGFELIEKRNRESDERP